MFTSIKEKFEKQVLPRRQELFGVKNIMAAPRIQKVALNSRIKRGGNVTEEMVVNTLKKITGQQPVITKARLSISNFKIREGMAVGARVTLRGERALTFLDKLINVALPRVRDFSGLSARGLDGRGNLTIGFNEHTVFPESAGDDLAHLHGLEVTVVTTAKNREQGLTLLKELGFPFKKVEEKKEKKKKEKKVY